MELLLWFSLLLVIDISVGAMRTYEPRYEKTGFRVFDLVPHKPDCTARGLKFRIYKVEGLYYLYSENKGADQLCGYREADLRLCFSYAKIRFSHDAAHIIGSGVVTFLEKQLTFLAYVFFDILVISHFGFEDRICCDCISSWICFSDFH